MTTITLPKDLEDWARAEVAAGRAESVDALVADALAERRGAMGDVKALLDEARAQVARGEGLSLDQFRAHVEGRIARLGARAKG